MKCKWACLRLRNAFYRGHILAVAEYTDLKYLGFEKYEHFEYVLLQVRGGAQLHVLEANPRYCVQVFVAEDDMRSVRHHIKATFKTPALGHVCVLHNKPAMYAFLDEWYALPDFEVPQLKCDALVWGFPHVIVFDLDSTLITEQEQVQIRDPHVYDCLEELRDAGCVLVLWSYGSRDHVAHSLRAVQLTPYFDAIISEGSVAEDAPAATTETTDLQMQSRYVSSNFSFDMHAESGAELPKSPKVVIKILADKGVNYFKSITLVDDLPSNNFAYDYYVRVKRCPVPVRDWRRYQDEILDNLAEYDSLYVSNKKVK
ncbi:38k [Antheraea pernyi nucleopolyhedrovirus]|uniref:38K n=2 Tax=Antheraea pernyi nuclear polyhedrosis virus TaxID=161494 RepID=Q7T5G0_NPVAP|nr:38k [Antheraea pernyi nucleopolyhedrovirus]AWD33578.1 38K [Antheraea proylei nucleopolyhedrovirus]BBD50514.1 38K [Antheraea yamamai nucleopolyhedrovirus]BBD50666.1 38K [Samia cynthia nucleopolyhedrovirus]ABF50295.1 38k [Antheraea pernyi nucleopolyhedrovirus]ABQ12286.1 38K [Antheraea pernyi nucleopolyhedrovirus]